MSRIGDYASAAKAKLVAGKDAVVNHFKNPAENQKKVGEKVSVAYTKANQSGVERANTFITGTLQNALSKDLSVSYSKVQEGDSNATIARKKAANMIKGYYNLAEKASRVSEQVVFKGTNATLGLGLSFVFSFAKLEPVGRLLGNITATFLATVTRLAVATLVLAAPFAAIAGAVLLAKAFPVVAIVSGIALGVLIFFGKDIAFAKAISNSNKEIKNLNKEIKNLNQQLHDQQLDVQGRKAARKTVDGAFALAKGTKNTTRSMFNKARNGVSYVTTGAKNKVSNGASKVKSSYNSLSSKKKLALKVATATVLTGAAAYGAYTYGPSIEQMKEFGQKGVELAYQAKDTAVEYSYKAKDAVVNTYNNATLKNVNDYYNPKTFFGYDAKLETPKSHLELIGRGFYLAGRYVNNLANPAA